LYSEAESGKVMGLRLNAANFVPLGLLVANEGVMKTTPFTRPKHGAVTYLAWDELKAVAEHWKVDIKLD
jgi:hypothetical protein